MTRTDRKPERPLATVLATALALTVLGVGSARAASSCGNAFLEPPEQCDPPGSITCPPGSPAGAFLPCNVDCTCPTLPTTTTSTVTTSTTTTVAAASTTTTTTVTPPTTTTTIPFTPCTGPVADCVDHFTCYQTKGLTPPFASISGVTLSDEFENVTVTVKKPTRLCTPTNKNGEGTIDPATHVESYPIKQDQPHVKRSVIKVTNQLGTIRVDTVKPDTLLVPTSKDLTSPPGPPNPNSEVDHYKCYRIRVTYHTPPFPKGTTVSISDQFTSPPKLLSLSHPRHLCNPANKNSEGVKNPAVHLLCYTARPAKGQPKHVPRFGVFLDNQFGPGRVDTVTEREFCVPSDISFAPAAPASGE